MIIDSDNVHLGNEAMASVLLLYYHITKADGISNDETVYVEQRFNPYDYLDVQVADGESGEIDELLIRQGSVVFLLCDLNDMVSEYDDSYLDQIITQRILSACENGLMDSIPESKNIVKLIQSSYGFDYGKYHELLDSIYQRYIKKTFSNLVGFT